MAEALRKRQRFDEAVEYYRAAIEVNARLAPAHAGLGNALFFTARYEEAVESLARAASLGLEPAQAGPVRRLMGMALHELGRLDEAAEEYDRALRIDSRDTQALDRLGMLRFAQQRYEEALGLYRTLAEIEPGTANTHANIGVTPVLPGPTRGSDRQRRARAADRPGPRNRPGPCRAVRRRPGDVTSMNGPSGELGAEPVVGGRERRYEHGDGDAESGVERGGRRRYINGFASTRGAWAPTRECRGLNARRLDGSRQGVKSSRRCGCTSGK